MKKVKLGVGGLLMVAAMLISDSLRVIGVYFLAALMHEMGHLIAARVMKIRIKEIKLGFSGVRIVTDECLTSYKSEMLLAIAGPAVNIIAFFGALCYFQPIGGFFEMLYAAEGFMTAAQTDISGVLGFFALSSAIQAVVNLLPVHTFDGGRILYCLSARLFSESAAARILSVTTAVSTFILWTVALYLMLRVAAGLGIYVFAACVFAATVNQTGE